MAEVRKKLYPGEADFFKKNPHVSGMAAADDKVIENPHSKLSAKERKSVRQNESARIYMRKNKYTPNFSLTEHQKKSFKDYGSESDQKATVAARIHSGDPSAGEATGEQRAFAKKLGSRMLGKRMKSWMYR